MRAMKKIGDRRAIEDAGLDQPPAQHLHAAVVAVGVVLGGVVDQLR